MAEDFCADCGDPAPTGGTLLGPLPPCHANGCGTRWRDPRVTTPPGRLIVDVVAAADGAIECNAENELQVRVAGSNASLAQPAGCSNTLHRDPTTNSLWVEQPPISTCVDAEWTTGCVTTAANGEAGTVETGCAPPTCATISNTHCTRVMMVHPTITLHNAEMVGGCGTYELIATRDGVETSLSMFSVSAEPKVRHIIEDTSQAHNVEWLGLATYSGSVNLAPFRLAPGESATVCLSPRFRRRASDTGDTTINWGSLRLDLCGHSEV